MRVITAFAFLICACVQAGAGIEDGFAEFHGSNLRFGYMDRRELFTMQNGACLRGPMSFYDRAGAIVFSLGAGTDWPTGCSDRYRFQRKRWP